MPVDNPSALSTTEVRPYVERPSRKILAIAFAAAAVSDILSFAFALVLPIQWVLDLTTAFVLFVILGRRWVILPGLIAEAIPGMGLFPVWVLVVASIAVYDNIAIKPPALTPR